MNTDNLKRAHNRIRRAVTGFGRYRKTWQVLGGWAWFVILALGALLSWVLMDWAFFLPAWPLLISFVLVAGLSVWSIVRHLLLPPARRVVAQREALLIESLDEEMDNQLIGCLQLGGEVLAAQAAGASLGYSSTVAIALVDRTAEGLRSRSLRQLLDLATTRRAIAVALAVALGWGSLLKFAPHVLAARIDHLRDAWAQVLDDLFPVTMEVEPGNKAVVRGRPVTLKIHVIGARRDVVRLIRTNIELEKAERKEIVEELTLVDDRTEFTVASADHNFSYEFEYAGRRTPLHRILVADLPEINAINYEMVYPTYTGMPPRTIVGRVPRLYALAGTSVLVSFAATTELHPELCKVEWAGEEPQQITISGRFGHFPFTIDRPGRATIYLTGHYGDGFEMENPLSFGIEVQRDKRPSIRILGSSRDEELIMLAGEAANIGIAWLAEDDFGVTEVNLEYKIDTIDPLLQRPQREGVIPRQFDPPLDRVRGKFQGMFQSLDPRLAPGDRITLSLSAKDNDVETGPQLGRSRTLKIVIVSPDLRGFVDGGVAGFGSDTLAAGLLGELELAKRALNLLVDPEKTIRTEPAREMEKTDVKSRVAQESSPPGSEDAVSNYFDLLSGQ
ncbi:MAG: hypothetical protein IH987_15960 [Planctomycetes bacterium]|nr:hypothetical protein [Planctomycetota bacterium]